MQSGFHPDSQTVVDRLLKAEVLARGPQECCRYSSQLDDRARYCENSVNGLRSLNDEVIGIHWMHSVPCKSSRIFEVLKIFTIQTLETVEL